MHEPWELQQMQSLPPAAKVIKTRQRIQEWYEHWDGQVYVSFSGGKDSKNTRGRCSVSSVYGQHAAI